MPKVKVKTVEKQIWDLEGFDVTIKKDNKDVRGDRGGMPSYPFDRMAKNDMTVSEWVGRRFTECFPGFDADVLDGNGDAVTGQTKLGSVRDTYSDDAD